MTKWIAKGGKALWLAVVNPRGFWARSKPYLYPLLFPPKSGEVLLNGIRFPIDINLDPVMKSMYYGTYEADTTSLLRRYLQEGDVFIDIGANVGFISAFALGLVGKTGEVHAFEPVPRYFERLKRVQIDNPDYHLYPNRIALGDNNGTSTIAVTNVSNIGWNTMVPDFMNKDTIDEEIETPVMRLDSYLSSRGIDNVHLIKIDTEGYEFPVLRGFQEYLHSTNGLPIIIAEVAPAAYPKLNTSLHEFSEFMARFGYIAYRVDSKKEVDVTSLTATTDVVFLSSSGSWSRSGSSRGS